jgi:hypothetical protein
MPSLFGVMRRSNMYLKGRKGGRRDSKEGRKESRNQGRKGL